MLFRSIVHCQNCGYEITFSESQVATVCPMCSSTQVATIKQQAGIPPEAIIPFKVDEQDAKAAFSKWVKSRWFAPNDFKKRSGEGALLGMYLPYWTYDAVTNATYKGRGGTHVTVTDDEGKSTTETEWCRVSGTVEKVFDDILISATVRESEIEDILPFDTVNHAIPYDASYLSGYHAELYTVKADVGFEQAQKKIVAELKNLAAKDIEKTYDESDVDSVDVKYREITYKHILLPVWGARYGYKNKTYHYYVNGDTGAVAGGRPYSVPKIVVTIVGVIVIIVLLIALTGCAHSPGEMVVETAYNTSSSTLDTDTYLAHYEASRIVEVMWEAL